jgi:aryl-alcohol dehydrogenase-like predicted oxidoreductase
MKYRKLGGTGIKISEIGFGSWAIGKDMWGQQSDKDSIEALNKALDIGCNFFDTALSYGAGHSEKIIGKVMKDRKCLNDVVIATKVPPKNGMWSPPSNQSIEDAFPHKWIMECCEKSLKNFGRSYIDLLQLHTWNKSWDNEIGWHDSFSKLKASGKIRAFGISVSGARHNEANIHVINKKVDSIQVVYNILDQNAEKELFPLAKKHGVGIIARVPLANGGLTGKFTDKTKFKSGDWRGELRDRNWLLTMVKQVGNVKKVVGNSMPLNEAAIKFCLSNESVSSVIPGVRNAKQAELNFSISKSSKELSEEQLAKLRKLWAVKEVGGLGFP